MAGGNLWYGVLNGNLSGPFMITGDNVIDAVIAGDINGDATVDTADLGILLCGSGIGISIAANRYVEIRAALVSDALAARLAREHNDANVICFGGRMIGPEVARDCLRVFMETPFEGGRHERRVDKLSRPL